MIMEPNTLIYALNEFIVIYRKFLLIIDTIFNIFSIIKFHRAKLQALIK